MDFLALLKKVGFEKAEQVGETGFNSSPKTKGVLIRAEKPTASVHDQKSTYDTKLDNENGHHTRGKITRLSVKNRGPENQALICPWKGLLTIAG